MTSSASGTGSTGWQSSQGPKQQLTGLASGMDTQSIVTQLMAIEKQGYDKLQVKKETEQLRLQAYQAVNSMLLKFKSSITNLSSQKLWNSKLATSSNESSLKATASQYAVNGTYNFRVTQTASQAEYTSKGFSDTKEAFGKANADGTFDKLGTITINSAKSRVDTSAKLESLNGGKGVFRGSIRITDAKGGSGTVDLSGCETVSDVVNAINNGNGYQIKASIGRKDGESFIELFDETGGSGTLKVQDVGLGTTAKDLGLNVAANIDGTNQTLSGRNVFYLGRDTSLSEINDGLGAEIGNEQSKLAIQVQQGGVVAQNYVIVDLSSAKTVGDVMDAVNSAMAKEGYDAVTLGLNKARNGFEFDTGTSGINMVIYNDWETAKTDDEGNPVTLAANPKIAEQLGLSGSFVSDASGHAAGKRLLGDVDSPLLSNLSGANGKGIGSGNDSRVPGELKGSTLLSDLNGGQGVLVGTGLMLAFHEGDTAMSKLNGNILDSAAIQALIDRKSPPATVDDLLTEINNAIKKTANDNNVQGLQNVRVEIEGNGLVWKGLSSADSMEVSGTLAVYLGLDRIGGELGGSGSNQAIKDLYTSKGDTPADGDTMISDKTLLENLQALGETDYIKNTGGIAQYQGLSGSDKLEVTIGSQVIDLQGVVDALSPTSTIEDLMDAIHTKIKTELANGTDIAPTLYYSQQSQNALTWTSVDLSQDFKVSGKFAEALGLDRNYTGQTAPDVADEVKMDLNPMVTGYLEYVDIDGTNATTLKLSDMNHGKGLSLSGEANDTITLTFTPGKSSSNNPVTISATKAEIELALKNHMAEQKNGTDGDYTGWEDMDPHEATLEQYLDTLNSVIKTKVDAEIAAGKLGADATFVIGTNQAGLFIRNAYGSEEGETIQLGGELVMNGTWGLGNTPVVSKEPDTNFTGSQLSFLLPAIVHEKPINGLGTVTMNVDGDEVVLTTDDLTESSSLREMMESFNKQLAAKGHDDVQFTLNASGTGLALDNSGNKSVSVSNTNDADVLAGDLGLVAADGKTKTYNTYSVTDGLSLGRRFIDRSTTLTDLAGTKTLELTAINITNTLGSTMPFSVENCKTVGDVVDAINMIQGFGIRAEVNETGDGISIYEYWAPGNEPKDEDRKSNIKISDEGAGNIASLLGIDKAGEGYVEGLTYSQRSSAVYGSVKKTLDVKGSDTLESLMNSLSGLGFKTAIVDDGSGANSKRLKVMSTSTGAANDFVLDCDLAFLGLTQTSRGKDAKVLSGDPSSGSSPMMISSPTNTNSRAIPGLTLEIKEASEKYTTITVDTDKTKVAEEIKNMVQTYNDLNDFIAYLDGIDPETYEKGILFGDTSVRSMMESIDDMFYQVYNPDGYGYGEKNEKTAWTWMDLGISFDANQTNKATGVEGSGWYSTMTLDEEVLNEMIASDWDTLYNTMASQRNASNSKLSQRVAAQATFNFKTIYDKDGNPIDQVRGDPHGAINNDYGSTFENGNGFVANNTIAQGENEYTIFFQGNVDASRIDIYHGSADTALSDFTIEYLDAATGKWETFRKIEGNTASSNVGLTFVPPRQIQGLRIIGNKTNAADGKFRLLDVQVLEDTGLAGKLNKLTSSLGDVTTGWLAEQNETIESTIKDLNDQMTRQSERLEAKEASLWRQFTAMEVAMSKLQNQSSQLSGLLSSLSS